MISTRPPKRAIAALAIILFCVPSTGVIASQLAGPIESQLAPAFETHREPLVHPLSDRAKAKAFAALNCSAYCGTPVSYTSWSNRTTTLQQYDGINVRVLIPAHWFDDVTFSEDTRRRFVDSLDITYQYLSEIVGRAPSGSGRITVAFVNPPECGEGCGRIGSRGVEYMDYTDNSTNLQYWQIANNGLPYYGLVHELTHNFDVYGNAFKFRALSDANHFWTYVLRTIYPFSRSRTADVPPREYGVSYEKALLDYRRAEGASWNTCLIERRCADQINGYNAPLGLFYRLVHRYGVGVATRWIQFLADRSATVVNPSDSQRLDAFFEAYSAAANRNMNCVFDALDWPVSATARTWANETFPNPNTDCTTLGPTGVPLIFDIEGDFMLPLDASVHRFAPGPGSTNNWTPTEIDLPAHIASAAIANTPQFFVLRGSSNRRVRINACSPPEGLVGSTVLWHSGYGEEGPAFVRGRCDTVIVRSPLQNVGIEQEASGVGSYSLQAEVNPYGEWPRSPWANLRVERTAQGTFVMTVAMINREEVQSDATAVRFWVQNVGWVASVPWSAASTFTANWTPAPGESGEGRVFRAQVVGGTSAGYAGRPNVSTGYASDQTNAVVFRSDRIFGDEFGE